MNEGNVTLELVPFLLVFILRTNGGNGAPQCDLLFVILISWGCT
jgi:hypothetical protein